MYSIRRDQIHVIGDITEPYKISRLAFQNLFFNPIDGAQSVYLSEDIDKPAINFIITNISPINNLAIQDKNQAVTLCVVKPKSSVLVYHIGNDEFSFLGAVGDTQFDWKESVIDSFDPTGGLPPSPAVGDRWISDATANGWVENYIYEWNGVDWSETPIDEGAACTIENEDAIFYFNSTTWVRMSSVIDHDNLLNYDIDEHRPLDDSATTITNLWSAAKTEAMINGLPTVTTNCSTTVAIRNPVYIHSDNYARKANASSISTSLVVGIVESKPTANTCVVRLWGALTGFSTLIPGKMYYLGTTAGTITDIPPSGPGEVVTHIGKALTNDVLLIELSNNYIIRS